MEFKQEIADLREYYEKEIHYKEQIKDLAFQRLISEMERFLNGYKEYNEIFNKYDQFMDKIEEKDNADDS